MLKLSNVIGAPFDRYVLDQLYIRAARNSTISRTTEDILFLANKTAWVRLISSVDVVALPPTSAKSPTAQAIDRLNALTFNISSTEGVSQYYANLGLDTNIYKTSQDLAKNWILEAGTSYVSENKDVNLRSGLGLNGAYGLGGIQEQGYRPMPGLTSVNIETAGRLGSLRYATIEFKVWNMEQLNVIEALYFRLGYSMLLEWGHTQYFTNPKQNQSTALVPVKNTYGLDDPFAVNQSISSIQQKIVAKKEDFDGNYDGMLGIVTSFNWSFNQDGGYDCNVKLIGKGAIMDSLRINQSYKMPEGVIKVIEKFKSTEEDLIKKLQEQDALLKKQKQDQADIEAKKKLNEAGHPTDVPKNLQDLYNFAVKYDGYEGAFNKFKEDEDFWWYTGYSVSGVNTVPDWYYTSKTEEYNKKWVGLFIQRGGKTWQVLHTSTASGNNVLTNQFTLNIPLLNQFLQLNINNDASLKQKIDSATTVPNIRSTFTKQLLASAKIDNGFSTDNTPVQVINSVGGISAFVQTSVSNDLQVEYLSGIKTRSFFFEARYMGLADPAINENYFPTVSQIAQAFDAWISQDKAKVYLTGIETKNRLETTAFMAPYIAINGTITLTIATPVVNIVNKTTRTDVNVRFNISFDNTSFIDTVLPTVEDEAAATAAAGGAASGNTKGEQNNPSNTQDSAAKSYESSLHVMLAAIKSAAEIAGNQANEGLTLNRPVIKVPLTSYTAFNGSLTAENLDTKILTSAFFSAGVFKDVLTSTASSLNPNGVPYDLVKYAQKGFNSYLMANGRKNPLLYDETPFVKFEELGTAYWIGYRYSNDNESVGFTNSPVYIKLGYLLALLNNLCLIYDSNKPPESEDSKGAKKEPYVFIDFNPDTNLCLTSPQHLSIDPKVCLIPFQGSKTQYEKIFPTNVGIQSDIEFDPATDYLSNQIKEFKTSNQYQGKLMNILINVDYLMSKMDGFASSDSEHGVYLQPYLEAIMQDVNKSLGNQNKFRVAYRDDSNTIQILDDQFAPPDSKEPDLLDRNTYIKTPAIVPNGYVISGSPRYGQLPIFGAQSLTRHMSFQTNLSTKLASMIAISAQAASASVNATDASSLTYLNQSFQDRYKPYINNAGTLPSDGGVSAKAANTGSNDAIVADQFNAHIVSIYSFSGSIDADRIDTAKNYYIERVSNTKTSDPVTAAAPFIPADLEITIDGISGIVMGNAFTIPEDRLPNSLRGPDGFTKVGFIVAGLTHTIQENEWLTKIKGQMIKLRENTNYGQAATFSDANYTPIAGGTFTTATDCTTSYPSLPILTTVQYELLSFSDAASYLKKNHPDIGLAVYALLTAEAGKSGSNFRSAGGYNYGGVQTDAGVWGYGNFVGQFCRRDSGGVLRMFAAFSNNNAFLDFLANRVKSKGFTTNPDQWTTTYINEWWSPNEKASYTKGTGVYNEKLSIFRSAQSKYNQA